ncbi:MAG TPA: aminotransferase class V-fold PLP-dependent enzyme [Acidimicrobiales bacterium]
MFSRSDAEALDATDPLARWRDEFVVTDADLVYLDGNSLGIPSRRAIEAVHAVLADGWATGLIRSWDDGWLDLPQRTGAVLAPLLGVDGDEVIVHDSTSVNLFQLVHAALALRPDRRVIAVDPADFPSDVYVVAGVAARTGHEVRAGFDRLDDVAVVVRSMVDFRTAEVVDLAGETARATAAGALVIWDLSHPVGVLQLDLHGAGVELAVGCTYKFLGSGPGGPAFSYLARALQAEVDQPIWGWFGRDDQFAMPPTYEPRPDIGRLLIGTPGIIGLVAAKAAIEVVVEAGIEAIQAKATALTGVALELCDQWGLDSPTPRDPARRGGHVSVRHPEASRLVDDLMAVGIVTDFREPDLVRLGCSPLTTRFTDVYDGVAGIVRLLGP